MLRKTITTNGTISLTGNSYRRSYISERRGQHLQLQRRWLVWYELICLYLFFAKNFVNIWINRAKWWSICWICLEANSHQFVDSGWTPVRWLQNVSIFYVLDNFLVGHAVVRLKCVRKYFPKADPKGPHVRLNGVLIVQNTLQRHPPDWNCVVLLALVVVLKR